MKPFDYSEAIGEYIAGHDIKPGERLDININGRYVAAVKVMEPKNEKVQFKLIETRNIWD